MIACKKYNKPCHEGSRVSPKCLDFLVKLHTCVTSGSHYCFSNILKKIKNKTKQYLYRKKNPKKQGTFSKTDRGPFITPDGQALASQASSCGVAQIGLPERISYFLEQQGWPHRHDAQSGGENTVIWSRSRLCASSFEANGKWQMAVTGRK